jgi:hypothetical protein
VLIVYNFVQVVFNAWLFYEVTERLQCWHFELWQCCWRFAHGHSIVAK